MFLSKQLPSTLVFSKGDPVDVYRHFIEGAYQKPETTNLRYVGDFASVFQFDKVRQLNYIRTIQGKVYENL